MVCILTYEVIEPTRLCTDLENKLQFCDFQPGCSQILFSGSYGSDVISSFKIRLVAIKPAMMDTWLQNETLDTQTYRQTAEMGQLGVKIT